MILHYKDYEGSVEYDCEDKMYHGRISNIGNDLVAYQATTWDELVEAFIFTVDDYEDWIQQMTARDQND